VAPFAEEMSWPRECGAPERWAAKLVRQSRRIRASSDDDANAFCSLSAENFAQLHVSDHLHSASISDRSIACFAAEEAILWSLTPLVGATGLTHAFDIRPSCVVHLLGQRKPITPPPAPLGIEESHIRAIDLFAASLSG